MASSYLTPGCGRTMSRHHLVTFAAIVLFHCFSVLMIVSRLLTEDCQPRCDNILKTLYALLRWDYTANDILGSMLSAGVKACRQRFAWPCACSACAPSATGRAGVRRSAQ